MRFLIMPFIVFLMCFAILRTSGIWSTKKNWKRIAIESTFALLAAGLSIMFTGIIVILFN
jgi:hypothetical protein